ncbi:MAG: ACP S-malonyltransferase [Dehalococcoidia bacterium]|nr:ACP S-malonyltransferase [Dehalococcoidia bacterium]
MAAWLFPGQGSQQVGMGRDLFESSPAARRVFEDADRILGRPLSEICFEGPEDVLRRTENAQPAIMVVSLACLAFAKESGYLPSPPAFVAGHSLGEYTAAVASGALSFADGLRLVQERGRLMQQAGEENPGTLAAVLGLTQEQATELCRCVGAELCNLNAPGQIVIGGRLECVAEAVETCRSYGAKRAVPLNVSGAFHTSLMSPAVEGMRAALAAVEIRDPAIPLVANGTAGVITSGEELRSELLYQLTHPVLWQRSVELMADNGVSLFIEIGPGEVLTGLVRRTAPSVRTLNVSRPVVPVEG